MTGSIRMMPATDGRTDGNLMLDCGSLPSASVIVARLPVTIAAAPTVRHGSASAGGSLQSLFGWGPDRERRRVHAHGGNANVQR